MIADFRTGLPSEVTTKGLEWIIFEYDSSVNKGDHHSSLEYIFVS